MNYPIDEGYTVAFEKMESLVRIMDDAEVDRKAGFRLRYLRRCQMVIDEKCEVSHFSSMFIRLWMNTDSPPAQTADSYSARTIAMISSATSTFTMRRLQSSALGKPKRGNDPYHATRSSITATPETAGSHTSTLQPSELKRALASSAPFRCSSAQRRSL